MTEETKERKRDPLTALERKLVKAGADKGRPRWLTVTGNACRVFMVLAVIKTVLVAGPRPAEGVRSFLAAILWYAAGIGLLGMKRWGAIAIWILAIAIPVVAIYDYTVHSNSPYRNAAMSIGAVVGLVLAAGFLVFASIAAIKLWKNRRLD